MFYCYINKDFLEVASALFSILTPIVVCAWFFYNRRTILRTEFLKGFVGSYGGFISDTVNKSSSKIRFEGGIVLDIIQVESNGYFIGEFTYAENEVTLGVVNGPSATTRRVLSSINFIAGRLKYRWHFKFWKRKNPLLYLTNRVYKGKVFTVDRFDRLIVHEDEILQDVLDVIYYRESRTLIFKQKRKISNARLPTQFSLLPKTKTLLDPYSNVKRIFGI